MFKAWRYKMATWLLGSRPTQTRMYAMAKPSRLTSGWGQSTTSEDTELASSLRTARARSRELVRDAAYAKRAKLIIQNNIVGAGIGMQAQVMTSRGRLNDRINDDIERTWETWTPAARCHTGGSMTFRDLERQAMGQVFEAGEVFIRMYASRFADSPIPFALELIEAERLADEFQPGPVVPTARVRLGIEADSFHRPLAYWVRTIHPGELRLAAEETARVERITADQIIHLRLIDRWPQTRAIPWLHAAARKLNDMDGLTEAEITAARGAACYMGMIETPDLDTPYGETQADGSKQVELEPAVIEKLGPGEKFNFVAPNRPNAQLDPFMRLMLREVAAGIGCSYESLSRDYSQSNYSSSRLALLDDRDLWRMLQAWFIGAFREIVHRRWLQQAILSRAITSVSREEYASNPIKFEAVRFKPRGWSWIDPTKEVEAYRTAIRSGFTTVSEVIAMTAGGRDLEDVMKEREHELDMMDEMGLTFESDPEMAINAGIPAKPPQPQPEPEPAPDQPPPDETVDQAERILRNHAVRR